MFPDKIKIETFKCKSYLKHISECFSFLHLQKSVDTKKLYNFKKQKTVEKFNYLKIHNKNFKTKNLTSNHKYV